MMTAIVIDDEKQSRNVLKNLLGQFRDDIALVGEAENVETAYRLIIEKQPALVFLDIQMPRGDGFSLLHKFTEIPFEIIFVTSYDKYAINAIKFSALDYLLKPVEVKDLQEAIKKARQRILNKKSQYIQIVNLLHNISDPVHEPRLVLQAGDNMKLVHSKDIVSIESEGSYCNINTITGERYITAKYLKDFEDYFGEHSAFLRIHRGCMLNTTHIKSYSISEPCTIEMKNGATYEVSRRKKQEVLQKLKG